MEIQKLVSSEASSERQGSRREQDSINNLLPEIKRPKLTGSLEPTCSSRNKIKATSKASFLSRASENPQDDVIRDSPNNLLGPIAVANEISQKTMCSTSNNKKVRQAFDGKESIFYVVNGKMVAKKPEHEDGQKRKTVPQENVENLLSKKTRTDGDYSLSKNQKRPTFSVATVPEIHGVDTSSTSGVIMIRDSPCNPFIDEASSDVLPTLQTRSNLMAQRSRALEAKQNLGLISRGIRFPVRSDFYDYPYSPSMAQPRNLLGRFLEEKEKDSRLLDKGVSQSETIISNQFVSAQSNENAYSLEQDYDSLDQESFNSSEDNSEVNSGDSLERQSTRITDYIKMSKPCKKHPSNPNRSVRVKAEKIIKLSR
ncbi:hypothetical protein G9A89_008305 [Geosiphon pyriformis]|nr:hypothetical protein G9A89_008305 [Geosiphon pyriformis]